MKKRLLQDHQSQFQAKAPVWPATTMASNSTAPVYTWPHEPFWELDGFDFTISRDLVSQCRLAIITLYEQDWSTRTFSGRHPSKYWCERLISNNMALLFRALLFCKDHHTSTRFWNTAQHLSLEHRTSFAKPLANLFVQARKAYLRSARGCPNEPARLVDAWVEFLERIPKPNASPLPSWKALSQQWYAMRNKGEFINCGLQSTHRTGTALNTPMLPPRAAHHSMPAGPSAWRYDPSQTVVKIEEDSDGEPPANLAHASLNKPISKRKRKGSESPEAPGPHPLKRRANESREADERADHHLQAAESFRGPTHRKSPDGFVRAVQAEVEVRPAIAQHEASSSPGKSKASRSATRFRVTACEEKLAGHTNLIQAQGSKLSVYEKVVVKYGTKVEILDARVESLEQKPEIQGLVDELTDRLGNLDLHISATINKEWEEVRFSFEIEQAHINRHLDTLRNDLAVQKVRTEDVQAAADEHAKLAKKRAKSEKLQRDEIDELSIRITGLEGKLGDDKGSLSSRDEGMSHRGSLHAGSSLSALSTKIAQLEEMVKEQAEDK